VKTLTEAIWFIDTLAHVRVPGGATDGRLAIVEMVGPRGHMPPLHIHHREDEAFVVLEGELTVYVGNDTTSLPAGELAFAPKEVPHTFRVESGTARWLAVVSPAGFDRFVTAVGQPAEEAALPSDPVLPAPDEFAAICDAYGIELLGPPGTLPS